MSGDDDTDLCEFQEELARMNAETEACWVEARALALSPKETWIAVLTDPSAVQWALENVPDDATEEQVASFAFTALGLFRECDCGLPARVITGPELAEWDLALPGFGDLPDKRTLESIAVCPNYPGGCGWLEGTERVGGPYATEPAREDRNNTPSTKEGVDMEVKRWDPVTSPEEARAAIVGEVETHDDDGRVLLYVERDTLGRGLVFLNLDLSTDEDIANVDADFAEKGWSDRGGLFIAVPFDAPTARRLGALLLEAAGANEREAVE